MIEYIGHKSCGSLRIQRTNDGVPGKTLHLPANFDPMKLARTLVFDVYGCDCGAEMVATYIVARLPEFGFRICEHTIRAAIDPFIDAFGHQCGTISDNIRQNHANH